MCEIIHPVDILAVTGDASYWHYKSLIESFCICRRPWRRPKNWSVMLVWLSPMLWVLSYKDLSFSKNWSNIISFSFPVVFSSLPPLCAVPVEAASSVVNILTIIWSEITPSLATAAAWRGRKRSSPWPFLFTSLRCGTRPSTVGNTWIRSAFVSVWYSVKSHWPIYVVFVLWNCQQWYQKLSTTSSNICKPFKYLKCS